MEKNAEVILQLYIVKRTFYCLDEYGLYLTLSVLCYLGYPWYVIAPVLAWGILALVTAHMNLAILENMIGVDSGWILCWPFRQTKL